MAFGIAPPGAAASAASTAASSIGAFGVLSASTIRLRENGSFSMQLPRVYTPSQSR